MRIVDFPALDASVRGYLHEGNDRMVHHLVRPAVLICPGGAYRFCSARERDPAAMPFFTEGYNVFLLEYSCAPDAGGCRPLREVAEALRTVRRRAGEWGIEPDRIALLGFSAGGHLAASLGVHWNHPELKLGEDSRPDALILCYPVITTGEFAHRESADNVTGGDPALAELFSLEHHAGAQVPPTFLWHTVDDPSVPVENSMLFAAALQRSGVPFECHLFAHGEHGISACTVEVETPNAACAAWIPLCLTWLNTLFSFTP